MNRNRSWPGSRWWRVDLHTHSPASADFRGSEGDDWNDWIKAAVEFSLDAVAITDHNTAAGVSKIQAVANTEYPVLFPGAEVTAADGVHLVFVMDPTCREEHVADLLSKIGIPVDDRGTARARSNLGVERILETLPQNVVIFAPHVNGPKGILTEHEGQQRLAVLRDSRLAAVEVNPDKHLDEGWLDGSKREVGRRIPQIWSSDAHAFGELGRRFTWIKMTRPNIEGLRLALMDGHKSLKTATRASPSDPNSHHGSLRIERISVRDARFMGRKEPLVVRFNPWLNAIIGGRGTGKSTLIDFFRKTLRRDEELSESGDRDDGSLKNLFDRRIPDALKPGYEGLLTANTHVEVVYRKHEQRFALSWTNSGRAPSIVLLSNGARKPEAGSVRERFPIRIFSQKQLFAMARDQNSLMTFIDDNVDVDAAAMKRDIEHLKSEYLSIRAQFRAAAVRTSDLHDCHVQLRDVQHKLDALSQGDHAPRFNEYRTKMRWQETWQVIVDAASHSIDDIFESAEHLSVADLDLESSRDHDDALQNLGRAHEELKQAIAYLKRIVHEGAHNTRHRIEEILEGPYFRRWQRALKDSQLKYGETSTQLAALGISHPNEYANLVARVGELRRQIQKLEKGRARAQALESKARQMLRRYRMRCDELRCARSAFATKLTGETIRVELAPRRYSDKLHDELIGLLENERFEPDRKVIADRMRPADEQTWDWIGLDDLVRDIRRFQEDENDQEGENDNWPTKDARFLRVLRDAKPENIDRLALHLPNDTLNIAIRDLDMDWKPLSHGSPGQQSAALLALVLSHGEEPIILDQPEDDLDNTLIYDLLVRQLRENKNKRQIIVVTHNPNIVVHGDAEFVLSLEAGYGESRIACDGGLQEKKVRYEICRVMEGGREAFENRYKRIMSIEGDAE